MAAQTDRNLLFGALALQLEFISQDSLVKGINHWLLKKDQSLCDILVEQESLSAEHRQLLQQLVDAHGQIRAQRPEEIPAAPNLAMAGLAAALQQIDDEELQQSLSEFSTSPDSSSLSLHRGVPHLGERFVNARPLAKGGLGEVSIALDRELNREVAFKQVRQEYAANGEASGRFRLEAEVTGRLEHPGIVPVYSFGTTGDGRPFYAMRLIRGESLHEAIRKFHTTSEEAEKKPAEVVTEDRSAGRSERRNSSASSESFSGLEFRQLLQRFISVCQAVSYAHSRGVLHRDLKPANIMLGKYGETLVVDWGLAKAADREDIISTTDESVLQPRSGSGATPTMQGSAIGTPGYMSPEQAAGDLARMSPASDVYSLGATLYQVLTGTVPFHRSVRHQLLDDVRAGRWTPVREVLPEVPVPLAAICEKAMAFDPSRRYSTPQELGNDIERFLADEPVSATVDPITIRLRRWIRRHQTIAVTSAAVVLVIAITTAVFSIILSAKNDALVIANRSEQEAKATAESNEKAARDQSQLALTTLTSVISEIGRSLEDLPGAGRLRQRLLLTSLERLKSVSSLYLPQSKIDRTTWLALTDMSGELLQFRGTETDAIALAPSVAGALPREETKMIVDLAEVYLLRALEIAEHAVKTEPASESASQDLAMTFQRLGYARFHGGRLQEAAHDLEQSRKIFNKHSTEAVSDAIRETLALNKLYLGMIAHNRGEQEEAARLLRECLTYWEPLSKERPDDDSIRRKLSATLAGLGTLDLYSGRFDEASDYFERSLAVRRECLTRKPDSAEMLRQVVDSLDRLGRMEMRRSQWPAAARHYSEAVTLYRTVVEQDPSHLNHRVQLARMLHLLSMTQAKTGLKAIAGESLGESIQILRALASETPDEPSVLTALSNSVGHHGTMLLQENGEQAIAALQESLAICRRLLELEPQLKGRRSDVASALGQLAEGLEHLKLHKDAIRYAQEGELLYQELQQSEPTRQSFRDDRIRILKVLMQANLELQQSQQAVEYAETMVPLIREASTKQGDINDESSIATLYFIGDFYIQQRRWDDAISRFDVLRSIGEKILRNDPSDGEMKRNLSIYFDKLAVAYRGKQQPAEALVHAKESLRLREELFGLQPADYQIQVDLVYSHSQIVDLQQQLANSAEGIEHLQQCLKLQEQMLKERPTDNELNDAYYSNHLMMSELQLDLGKYADAASMRRLAIDLRKRGLATAEPGKLESLNADIRAVEQMIIRIENAERALDDWENILQVPELELPLILETRMYFLKRQRRFMEGVQTAEKICELPNVPANVLYNAACMFSIAAEETAETTASEAESVNKKESADTEALTSKSLKAFEKAINAGFTQFEKARTDVNLRPLHNLPEFQRLVMDKVGPQTQP